MPESAGLYVSKNKYLILLYISHYIFSRLAEKTASRKSLCFNRLEFLAYDPALSGIRPQRGGSVCLNNCRAFLSGFPPRLRCRRFGRQRIEVAPDRGFPVKG